MIKKIFKKIKRQLIYLRYLYFRFIKTRMIKSAYINPNVSIQKIDNKVRGQSFFGYYNLTPSNSRNEILFNEVSSENVRASINTKLEIFIYTQNNNICKVGETNSWNWQQGCMLQWYGNNDEEIIYNKYNSKNNKYYSEIKNIRTNQSKIIEFPVYSVSKDGEFALTLNFDRLSLLRPDYGYFNRNEKELKVDENDGVWRIDINNNSAKLIITLKKLRKYKSDTTMQNAVHKVNHIDISPNAKRFMFLHRWISPKGRFMRLLTANSTNGNDLFVVTGNKMVSHNCWWGSEYILSFCKLSDGRNRYVKFKDKEGLKEIIGENSFQKDGHPSVSPDKNWIVTDEYPDISRFSRLYLYNLKQKKKYLIGTFYQPIKNTGERRIDLHPRWSKKGNIIFIDSGHSGIRKLYKIDISIIIGFNN